MTELEPVAWMDLIWIIPSAVAFVIGAYVIIKDELDGGPSDWIQ